MAKAKPPKMSRQEKALADLVKQAGKAKPPKLYPILVDLAALLASAGRAAEVGKVIGWAYGGGLPAPKQVPSVLSTPMLDVLAAALGLGDVTQGAPSLDGSQDGRSHAQRVATAEADARERITTDAFDGMTPVKKWRDLPADDRRKAIFHWREAQRLVREGKESAALAELRGYLEAWSADSQGVADGDELVLALDLAFRLGREALAPEWLAQHGWRLLDGTFTLPTALCFPHLARAALKGALQPALGIEDGAVQAAMTGIEGIIRAAEGPGAATASGKGKAQGGGKGKVGGAETKAGEGKAKAGGAKAKPPRVQKRRVTAEYSQFSLEPAEQDATERAQVFFQKKKESTAGFSAFPTQVGIATPSDTAHVDIEVRFEGAGKPDAAGEPDLDGVTRAVAFPLEVRGPLVLRSATMDPDEPLEVPPGRYDVLVRFYPKKAPKAEAAAGLGVFRVDLAFHPEGSLGAPRTLRMDE